MRKISVFAGVVGGIALAGSASAALQSLSMELVNSGAEGNTYRLMANLDAGARVDAVYGNSQGALSIAAANGATMYHNANGGPTSKEINSNFFPFVPSMEWDSYVSIGALYQNGAPFGANNLNNIGVDWASWEGGGDLYSDNGSWFVTPDDAQGAELNGQVFLGQFTVQGGLGTSEDLVGQINLQGKDASGETWNAIGASWTIVPAPGALALLGLAGVAGRRRRRG
ncbi:MAG: hypothetical protein CMJ40_06665 [Phycisphaerae bacterium]|nr:hypothetical protein [Phycisphaerae bacterium]